jgi:hypothetical protein
LCFLFVEIRTMDKVQKLNSNDWGILHNKIWNRVLHNVAQNNSIFIPELIIEAKHIPNTFSM